MSSDSLDAYNRNLAEQLVNEQLKPRGIVDSSLLDAFLSVPREVFVTEEFRHQAYENVALSVGYGQTISQPLMIAIMLQAMRIKPGMKVLEVGTGTGYEAALMAEMGANVVTIERIPELAQRARANLENVGYPDVLVVEGDGSLGYPEKAPYDRIIIACAAPRVPDALKAQLADGGILVAPIGPRQNQVMTIVCRVGDEYHTEEQDGCYFVPLIGEQGWDEEAQDFG